LIKFLNRRLLVVNEDRHSHWLNFGTKQEIIMKKIALLLAGVVGIASAPAHAALSINLSLPSGTFDSPSIFCASGTSCPFSETVTFTTPSPFNLVSASITTIAVGGVGSTSDINFTSVVLDGVNFTLTSLLGGVFEVGGLANLSFLAPGSHTLTVTGTTFGTGPGADGSYSGTLTFAAANPNTGAVPEPATWLSMIMGFGALGFAMRSKTQQTRRVNFKFA
jgi:PEP-CTERM motif